MSEMLSLDQTIENHPRLFELTKSGGVIYQPINPIEEQLTFALKHDGLSSVENLPLNHKLTSLIESKEFVDLEFQSEAVRHFWQTLGFDAPKINAEVERTYLEKYRNTPTRLVAVPALTMADRKLIYKRAKTYFSGSLVSSADSGPSNDESIVYSNLLRDTESLYQVGDKKYGLRYLSDDKPLSRKNYLNWLASSGKGIVHKNRVWTFVPMNFHEDTELGNSADDLFKNHEFLSPESLITRQMLLVASGKKFNWIPKFCNEIIFEIGDDEQTKYIAGLVMVNWNNVNQTGHLSIEK